MHRSLHLAGKTSFLGNNEPLLPVYEPCPGCGHARDQFVPKCKNCQMEFWCRWQSTWYEHPLTLASMGQSPRARRAGHTFGGLAVAFFLYSLAVFLGSQTSASEWERVGWLGAVMVYSAYEVWAFTHGRRTSIDHWRHDGTPENTNMRVFGLVLDLLFCLGASALIVAT